MNETTIRELNLGRYHVRAFTVPDEDAYFDYIGEWSSKDRSDTAYVYSRAGDVMRCPGQLIWRDRHGQMAVEPEEWRGWDRLNYTHIANNGSGLRYAFIDADRLEALERGDWAYVQIGAEVSIDNGQHWAVEPVVGRAYLSGIESDSDRSYIFSEARNLIHEAVEDARATRLALIDSAFVD